MTCVSDQPINNCLLHLPLGVPESAGSASGPSGIGRNLKLIVKFLGGKYVKVQVHIQSGS